MIGLHLNKMEQYMISTEVIAIISNINGNIFALNDFLNYVNAYPEIKYIINLGNFLGGSGYSVDIFDRITNDHRFVNILGPNEINVINKEVGTENIINELGKKRIDYLETILTIKEIDLFGKKFLLAHSANCQNSIFRSSRLKFFFADEFKETEYGQKHFVYDYILYGCNEVFETSTYIDPNGKNKCEVFISPGDLYMHTINTISFCLIKFNENNEDIIMKKVATETNLIIERLKEKRKYKELYDYCYYNIDGGKGTLLLKSKYDEATFNIYYKEFWNKTMEFLLPDSHFVEFRMVNKKELVDEIKNKMKSFSEDFLNKNDIVITGEINEYIKTVLLYNFLDDRKNFKWTELGLLNQRKELIFSFLKHDGLYQFLKLDEDKMSYIKTQLYKSDRFNYEVYDE